MTPKSFILVIFLLMSYLSFAREIEDATHTRIQLVDRPIRIVTLAPSLGELVADLLGSELGRIVGVSEYTDYPPVLQKVTSIGPYFRFNLEKVVSLHPDLVLATTDGNAKDQVLHLRELGLPVAVVSTENFREIYDSIRQVGRALGTAQAGNQLASQMETGISRIRDRTKAHSGTRVMLQIGDCPLVVAGKGSFLQSSLETLSAVNVYGDSDIPYPRPSLEDVLHRNPEVIIIIALGDERREFERMAKKWNQFPGLRAVQKGRVHILKSDTLLRPTLRILEGLSQLNQIVYGKN